MFKGLGLSRATTDDIDSFITCFTRYELTSRRETKVSLKLTLISWNAARSQTSPHPSLPLPGLTAVAITKWTRYIYTSTPLSSWLGPSGALEDLAGGLHFMLKLNQRQVINLTWNRTVRRRDLETHDAKLCRGYLPERSCHFVYGNLEFGTSGIGYRL